MRETWNGSDAQEAFCGIWVPAVCGTVGEPGLWMGILLFTGSFVGGRDFLGNRLAPLLLCGGERILFSALVLLFAVLFLL